MDEWTELRQEVGKNVEDIGRMLKRKPAFTYEDLSCLRDALSDSSEAIQIIRDNTLIEP